MIPDISRPKLTLALGPITFAPPAAIAAFTQHVCVQAPVPGGDGPSQGAG